MLGKSNRLFKSKDVKAYLKRKGLLPVEVRRSKAKAPYCDFMTRDLLYGLLCFLFGVVYETIHIALRLRRRGFLIK